MSRPDPLALTPRGRGLRWFAHLLLLTLMFCAVRAHALPVFARQTGQNCLSCHAGGQFPELTPYGRMFKMTGYTIGARTLPLSVMGLASDVFVANTNAGGTTLVDQDKNGQLVFATGSLFLAGKITDNTGAFAQITYDNYASQDANGSWHGFTSADNMDFRYADRSVDENHDLVWGVSLNNNPSVSDPWNTAAAWMQYVPVPSPGAYQFIDGAATPFPGYAAGGPVAGLTGYLFWNQHLYLEAGSYRTANGPFSFMSFNVTDANTTHLSGGLTPYWRAAWNQEYGAHNLMVGFSGMVSRIYDGGSDVTDPNNIGSYRSSGVDAQYQYLLDPYTVTAQFVYQHQQANASYNSVAAAGAADAIDTTDLMRAKLSYVYDAKYGGSLAYFSSHGSANLQGNPETRGYTLEAFFMPVQYVRVGAQFTGYSTFQGASSNYDGAGRNAGDNNSLFLYVWGAY
jgi:hypothetical protein